MVVFRVADRQGVVSGQPEHVERRMQSRRLADRLGYRHDPAAVECEGQWKLEGLDCAKHANRVARRSINNARADAVRDASALQLRDE
jgi:hypothetical protein